MCWPTLAALPLAERALAAEGLRAAAAGARATALPTLARRLFAAAGASEAGRTGALELTAIAAQGHPEQFDLATAASHRRKTAD